jgi:uncharacterized protein (TIRG00374 family)
MPAPKEAGKRSHRIFFVVTNLVSLGCLIWVLHDANLGELRHEVPQLNWWWVALALTSDVLVYLWHGWRWTLLLTPVKPISFRQSVKAVYVGLFANEILPLRAGEVIRCFLQARWNAVPLSVSLASVLIERIFDGVWLLVGLFLTIHYVPGVHQSIIDGAYLLGTLIVLTATFLGVAMYWKEQTLDALAKAKWLKWVHILVKDLHLIGHSRYLYFAALISLPYLITQVVPIYAMVRAYHPLDGLPLIAACAMMVILRLGAVVPQAPGNLGAFQALAVVGLLLFHVPRALAKRFSVLLWAAVTLPLLLVGFIALAMTGANMQDLHREAQDEMNAREPRPGAGKPGCEGPSETPAVH